MRFRAGILSALGALLLLAGCNRHPKGILSEKEMIDLLTDMELAEAYAHTNDASADKINIEILEQSVLDKHGVTREQLDSTLSYYGRNLDEYYALYEKVENNLRAQSGRIQSEENKEEDDIWPYSRFTAMLPNQISDGIVFSFPAEGLNPGDRLEWKMRLSSQTGVDVMMGVEYDNGLTSMQKKNVSGTKNLELSFQTDTAHTAKRVFGTLTARQSSLPLWADSIRLVRAEFDSLNYSRIKNQRKVYPPQKKPLINKSAETEALDTVKEN